MLALDVQRSLRLLAVQYELAMRLGRSLNMREMLRAFLPKALSYLNCSEGQIWLLNKDTGFIEHPYSTIRKQNRLKELVNQFFLSKEEIDVSCIKRLNRKVYRYFMSVGAIGVVLLYRYEPLNAELINALKPIFNRLSLACLACMQYGLTESGYQDIFEHSPISIWEEDYSVVKSYLTSLQKKGIKDLDRYFLAHPKEVKKCLSMVKVNNVNQASMKLYEAETKADLMKNLNKTVRKEALTVFSKELVAFANNEITFKSEGITYTLNQKRVYVAVNCSVVPGYENNYAKVLVSILDIGNLKRAEARIDYLAKHDDLTGLPNRILFNVILERAINRSKRNKDVMAILYLDLDNFKAVNDTLGYQVGDLLLVEVAKKLQNSIRADDCVARLGGDEFAVILNGLTSIDDAGAVAEKLNKLIGSSYQLAKHIVHISTSIGIACYPKEGKRVSSLFKHADIALYAAKNAGRNTYQYFSANLNAYHSERLFIEQALNVALEKHEFYLVYQPKFELPSKEMIGIEVLLRWKHPKLGVVPPTKFIPIAEATGAIIPISEWILKTACQQFVEEFLLATRNKKLSISLNLSPEQIIHGNFFELIKTIIKETKISPKQLELELTETLIMSDVETSEKILRKLDALGIGISVDDFGTGYSSLSYLKRLPIRTLKIDQSFIQDIEYDPNDAVIVKTIINLAKNLGLNVIAEGVETKKQLAFLIKNGCHQVQGFYFSKPLTAKGLVKFLGKYHV